jgi:hypothetical protein
VACKRPRCNATELPLRVRQLQERVLTLAMLQRRRTTSFCSKRLHATHWARCAPWGCTAAGGASKRSRLKRKIDVVVSLSFTGARGDRLSGAEHQAERRRNCPCLHKLCAGPPTARPDTRRTPFGWLQLTRDPVTHSLVPPYKEVPAAQHALREQFSFLHGLQTRHSARARN